MVQEWQQRAWAGDHLVRVYDNPESWCLPYNLFMARVLDLEVMPPEWWDQEFRFLFSRAQKYGIPLEERFTYTKADWLVWLAAIAPTPALRDALIEAVASMLDATPDRVAFTDWYKCEDAGNKGFRARSVVGGVYAPAVILQRNVVRERI